MYGLVYCAQNFVNQKVYIGQITKTLKERKARHKKSSNLYHCINAYEKISKGV